MACEICRAERTALAACVICGKSACINKCIKIRHDKMKNSMYWICENCSCIGERK